MNPIDLKKVRVSFVSWCVFERHSKPLIFLYFLGLGLEVAKRCGTRVIYQRYGTTCFVSTLWDICFISTVMGSRVLYDRYGTPCLISTLRETLHGSLSGRHELHILYINITLAFNINTDFLKKS